MTTKTHIHHPNRFKAYTSNGTSWLEVKDSQGNTVVLFLEWHEAEALAAAWDEIQSEPDLPDAETIAARDEAYRRDIIAAGRGELLK